MKNTIKQYLKNAYKYFRQIINKNKLFIKIVFGWQLIITIINLTKFNLVMLLLLFFILFIDS